MAVFGIVSSLYFFAVTVFDHSPKPDLTASPNYPSLDFRPMPSRDQVDSTLIRFQQGNETTWKHWFNDLDSFLDPYQESRQYADHFSQCDWSIPLYQKYVCVFELMMLGNNCTRENYYGYHKGRPCVVVKMNRIWGWEPLPYRPDDTLPDNMPTEVRQLVYSNPTRPQVWISCEGEVSSGMAMGIPQK